jgi:hypothetical protein
MECCVFGEEVDAKSIKVCGWLEAPLNYGAKGCLCLSIMFEISQRTWEVVDISGWGSMNIAITKSIHDFHIRDILVLVYISC